MAIGGLGAWRTMQFSPARENPQKNGSKAAGVLLLLVGLVWLVAGQGVSRGGGSGPQLSSLSLASVSLNFGSVAAGANKTLSVTATNSGPPSVTVSSISVSSKYFAIMAPSLPATVAAGQSATLSVEFTP